MGRGEGSNGVDGGHDVPTMANTPCTAPVRSRSSLSFLWFLAAIVLASVMYLAVSSWASPAHTSRPPVLSVTAPAPVVYPASPITAQPGPAPAPVTITGQVGNEPVGQNIRPGTYRTAGGSTCYWAIITGYTVRNRLGGGPQTVTLKIGDDFQSINCGTWHKIG